MKNTILAIIIAISYSFIEYGYTQKSKCGIERFQCKNGQCIASELLCDGHADCKDKSDETSTECSKPEITCPDYAFRCSYGACVDGDATCNGIRDCVDNSDETLARCTNTANASASCARNQFSCNNGQCIAESALCDGTPDCTDNSDETFIQCGSLICSQFVFRCNYGACIDGDLKCNGVTNCADGSDEDPRLCSNIATSTTGRPIITRPTRPTITSSTRYPITSSPRPTITPITRPTPVVTPPWGSKSCVVPPQPTNGHWKLHQSQCCNSEQGVTCDHCDLDQGTRLERGAFLIYSCNSGYKLKGSAIVFCGPGGTWLNIPICTEIRCRGLLSTSTNARCTYNGDTVPCDAPVLPQTIAALDCRPSYREDTTFLARSRVRCNNSGQWEPEPIRCLPVCGVSSPNATPLIVNGTRPNITEFPWHATLYSAETPTSEKNFICGATIIRDRFLVTAAHCVYNEVTKRAEDASRFYVMTGNIYRGYDDPNHNPIIVKKAKVKNVYINCNYYGLNGNYAADIALLEIAQPFEFTSLLVPICLDGSNDAFVLEVGSFGKVAGFGRTAYGASSYILQTITVPYISFNVCKSTSATLETVKYATVDKFCAGYANGSSVCDGDSGGGLVFKIDGLWYLKGIVSVSLGAKSEGGTTICDSYSYSLYTRVSNYMSWIQDVILKVESKISLPPCVVISNFNRFK